MLKGFSAAALAASLSIVAIPTATHVAIAQTTAAPEPPKGATPSDNPGASSGSNSMSSSKTSMSSSKTKKAGTNKDSMKKSSTKKAM